MYRCIPKFCMQQAESRNLLQKQAGCTVLGSYKTTPRDPELERVSG